MGIILVLLDALFIGSVIGYSITGPDPLLVYQQNLLGLCAAVVGTVFVQIGFLLYISLRTKKQKKLLHMVESPLDTDQLDAIDYVGYSRHHINSDEEEQPGVWGVILPQAKVPYNLFLFIIRIIIVVWSMCVIVLLVGVVVFDRIIPTCPMPWNE